VAQTMAAALMSSAIRQAASAMAAGT